MFPNALTIECRGINNIWRTWSNLFLNMYFMVFQITPAYLKLGRKVSFKQNTKNHDVHIPHATLMNGEIRPLVANQPVEFEK